MKDTMGNEMQEIMICSACSQDTAGDHEWNCPNRTNKSNLKLICGKVERPISEETERMFYEKAFKTNPQLP